MLLCFLLLRPAEAAASARSGLLLWAHSLVPVLLPFFILSNLLIALNGVSLVTQVLYPVVHRLFGCSRNGCFCLAAGFLCGYPVGAKTTGDLVREGQIHREEGEYLLSFCNNASPAFLTGYCLSDSLNRPDLLPLAFVCIYGTPLLLALFLRKGRKFASVPAHSAEKKTSGFQSSFKIADACMMNGLESILKLGCYIILFSMLTRLIQEIPCPFPLVIYGSVGCMEMTNGVALICADPQVSPAYRYLFTLGFVSFGGLSGATQTSSMLSGSGLSVLSYLKAKVGTAILTCLLAFLLLQI